MVIKKNSLFGGDEFKKQVELLKVKMNGFLINYFNYLIFSLCIIILAVGLLILVYPKYKQIFKENEDAKKNLSVEYEAKSNYLNSILNLKKSYQLISEEEKAKIVNMIPAASDTSILITEIESIAVKNSAILTSIKIEPQGTGGRTNFVAETNEKKEPPAGIFNKLPQGVSYVKIDVYLGSVNYLNLKNIIKTFENNIRLFDIAKINFNVKQNQAILTIYSYYLTH